MDYAVVISAVVLGLSVLATIAKFLDWYIHSDPKTMVRLARWTLLLLFILGIPLLVAMIADERWSIAMLVGAGMLAISIFLRWRAMFAPLRALFDHLRPKPRPFDMPMWNPDWDRNMARDPEMVQRAAAILEVYLGRAGLPAPPQALLAAPDEAARGMSKAEALEVLGLQPDADAAAIRAAHTRLARLVHPDHSGSTWLAEKVDEARDTLLNRPKERRPPVADEDGNERRMSTS
jgi:hypothetical protein